MFTKVNLQYLCRKTYSGSYYVEVGGYITDEKRCFAQTKYLNTQSTPFSKNPEMFNETTTLYSLENISPATILISYDQQSLPNIAGKFQVIYNMKSVFRPFKTPFNPFQVL